MPKLTRISSPGCSGARTGKASRLLISSNPLPLSTRFLTLPRGPAETPDREQEAGQPPRGDDDCRLPARPDRLVPEDDVAHQPDEVRQRQDLRDHLQEPR